MEEKGRLYLVGGSQMVHGGYRGQTQDVDYAVRLVSDDHQEFAATARRLIREMDISVNSNRPGDLLPLPRGWEDRSPYVGRYGGLDVFTFDPVSTALAKIERGASRDIDDTLALLALGKVTLDQLDDAFGEILPRLERESLHVDEDDFRRKFEAFTHLARGVR